MTKSIKTLFAAIFAFVLLLPIDAKADEYSTEAVIPVTASLPATVVIEKITEDAPMPVSSEIKVAEKSSGKFQMTYTQPGEYIYRVYQKKKDQKIDYDTSEYEVTVYVEFTSESAMRAIVVAKNNADKSKPDTLHFDNKYKQEPTPEPTATPAPTPAAISAKTGVAGINVNMKALAGLLISSFMLIFLLIRRRKDEENTK